MLANLISNRLPKKMYGMILYERLLQKFFGKKLDVRKSWQETPAKFKEMVAFLNWFDTTTSIEDCLQKARIDWELRFKNFPYFQTLKKDACLEIGFGGGRLLNEAAKDFEHAYGVDIHENFAMTQKFLESQGTQNFTLIPRDNLKNLPDSSIGFVYSFIVFQHFDSMNEVNYYLSHIKRILTSDGVAHIYFGKNKGDGVKVTSSDKFHLRDCSLFVSPPIMREELEKDFTIIDFKDSLPRNAVTNTGESAQAFVIFKKK